MEIIIEWQNVQSFIIVVSGHEENTSTFCNVTNDVRRPPKARLHSDIRVHMKLLILLTQIYVSIVPGKGETRQLVACEEGSPASSPLSICAIVPRTEGTEPDPSHLSCNAMAFLSKGRYFRTDGITLVQKTGNSRRRSHREGDDG